MPDTPHLSVASVARRLGVAPATLRTWDRRYGLGPSQHTPGSHRRYGPDDLARLEVMQRALVEGVTPGEAARLAQVRDQRVDD
ncbi:MerR family transcriptional regulator, partial [Pseudonocardia pini]|uniref:MerR family transcriptional regulator n=1 Tax=Pseudonocardia pini TaxID=2758030 RepID=UPI0028B1B77F